MDLLTNELTLNGLILNEVILNGFFLLNGVSIIGFTTKWG